MPDKLPVCIFVKPPEAGKVKTRLASMIGPRLAAEFAEAFFQDTCAAVESCGWAEPVIACTGPLPAELNPAGRAVSWQGEGDLGARLERIMRRALAGSEQVIAIGSDTPGLPLHLLEEARQALASSDAALGPCEDGGFYLIGLRRCPLGLLRGIPWSQPDTLARTYLRLRRMGLEVALLPTWFDVDRSEDLWRLQDLISSGQIRAPLTARLLERQALEAKRVARSGNGKS